jgi:UMF1 family MFS transporter
MSTEAHPGGATALDEKEYRRRIRAWTLYDWANSAFATTVLAGVLPIYYSKVAGATLPSEATATAYWSLGLSISLLIVAVLSPILGTVSDIVRGKKRFLAAFAGLGIVSTALLVLVATGDWVLASILAVLGRIGFNGSLTFYDALLPHVSREEDRDRVSTRGYAMGYLGGGILLAVNVVMISLQPDSTWGPRLSFVSVAVWWAVFSIPLFLRVPEPLSAGGGLAPGEWVLSAGFRRLRRTLADARRYRELFKFLVAFLIFNDGIGTIIGVATIYGAELGFGSLEMVLALLLVQLVGIPFSLIFGRLPRPGDALRPACLAFILFNVAALPIAGIAGRHSLPGNLTGGPLPPYPAAGTAVGTGLYPAAHPALTLTGDWRREKVPAEELRAGGIAGLLAGEFSREVRDAEYALGAGPGCRAGLRFNGQRVRFTYAQGPDRGTWAVLIDGKPAEGDDGPIRIDGRRATVRHTVTRTASARAPGEHVLTLEPAAGDGDGGAGRGIALASIEVLPPVRESRIDLILGGIAGIEVLGIAFALLAGRCFRRVAEVITTKRAVMLALAVYVAIAAWGFILDSTAEFWGLAWMVAMVQGGSQALSRSLFSTLSPSAKSGEFFGLFSIMEKFSSFLGPLLFAAAGLLFDSTRPAILSLVALFVAGIVALRFVDVEAGRRTARAEDAALLSGGKKG